MAPASLRRTANGVFGRFERAVAQGEATERFRRRPVGRPPTDRSDGWRGQVGDTPGRWRLCSPSTSHHTEGRALDDSNGTRIGRVPVRHQPVWTLS